MDYQLFFISSMYLHKLVATNTSLFFSRLTLNRFIILSLYKITKTLHDKSSTKIIILKFERKTDLD